MATTMEERGLPFPRTKAYQRLVELAQNPIDLTKDGVLSPTRMQTMQTKACGITFLYPFERINEEVCEAFSLLVEERDCLKSMQRMQDGEVINRIEGVPSEERRVLHTAMRDLFEEKERSPAARRAVELAKEELAHLRSFLEEIDHQGSFTDLLIVGIGGSELGPKALAHALKPHRKQHRQLHFINNIDPDQITEELSKLHLDTTLVVIISKSGTTLETTINERFLRWRFEAQGLKSKQHFISVTMVGTPMDDPERYRAVFHFWDFIGGRFSATSLVGGLPLSFAFGYETYLEVLRGAEGMDRNALVANWRENLPLLGALLTIWNRNFLNHSTLAFIPYSEALSYFPKHAQQVEMESNGKSTDLQGMRLSYPSGPILFGEAGSSSQHSFFQLLHQGTTIVPLEMIGFVESQYGEDCTLDGTTNQEKLLANLLGQAIALAQGKKSDHENRHFQGNRPLHLLLAKKLTPYTLGALFSYLEQKVAFEGFLLGINSFDQEGVELGKQLAGKMIALFAKERGEGEGKKEPYPLGESMMEIIRSL